MDRLIIGGLSPILIIYKRVPMVKHMLVFLYPIKEKNRIVLCMLPNTNTLV